ncbi:ABC transporter permease [Priestia koreensis]|uniref:Sugar ABC transporter permease n=1 Tax=Priestia koreensis TaxID=284581 RepID=A0A0M0LHF1_9BACI|nr:ABC transporter permease [Priestia koreensis]KOO50495.1 sugar ABC transporter permease [Priestia koreensis]
MNSQAIENKEPVRLKRKKGTAFDFLYKYGTVVTILLTIVIFSILSPTFLTTANLSDILRSISIVTLIAIGVTISLTINGLDLSVGSTAGLATTLSASMLVFHRQEIFVAVAIPIVATLVVGLVNAFLVVKVKIPDILATLSMMFIVQGVLLTYTKGSAIYTNMPLEEGGRAPGIFIPSFLKIGQGEVVGIPIPVIIMLVAVLVAHLFFRYTKHGRFFYVTGGNMEAARLSGVPVNRYRMYAYVLSALFAGIGGVVLAARIGVGEVNAGSSFLMDAVAASYIGFSVFGAGKPNVVGTLFGSILIGVLLNGLTMLNVPYYAQDIIKGAVLAGALAITYYRSK